MARSHSWVLVVVTIDAVLLAGMLLSQGIFRHAGMDFLTSYTAAEMLRHGEGRDLYNTRDQWERQRPIVDQYDVRWPDRVMHPYIAPPLLGVLAVPFTLLSAARAALAWMLLNLAAVGLAVGLLAHRLALDGRRILALIGGSFPLFYVIMLGQVEGFLLLALVAFILELRAGRDIRAGLALAVFALKPPLLLAPLVFLIATGRRRALWTTVAATAVQAGVAVAIVGRAGAHDFVDLSRRLSGPEGTNVTNVSGMVNLRSIVVRALPTEPGLLTNLSIAALTVAMLGTAAWLWRRAGDQALAPAGLALLAVTTLLTSYHALYHTAIFVVLAIAVLSTEADGAEDDAWSQRLFALYFVFFAFGPLLLYILTGGSRMPAALSVIGALLVWGLAAQRAIQPAPAGGLPVGVTYGLAPVRRRERADRFE